MKRMHGIQPLGVAVILVVLASLTVLIAWKAGLLDTRTRASSQVAPVALPVLRAGDAGVGSVNTARYQVVIPQNQVVPETAGQPVRMLVFAWNAQMGMMFANGGPVTTAGSLMADHGVRLTLARQDDTSVMQRELISCAQELKNGAPDCRGGAHFVAIMGDGGAMFLRGLNEQLRRFGPEMTAEVVASAGFSRGEDKLMGPPAWRANPQAARGGTIAGVLKDGDWNIAMAWAHDNGLCNNADATTYDPNCLNWVGTASYLEPVEKYNQGACETRPVVRDGRRTSETHRTCVDAVVTWTPGDVNVVNGRGGLVSILSTRENAGQMPNAIIGIRHWNRAHRAALVGLISAIGLGGQAVNTDPRALAVGSQVSQAVYRDETANAGYWRRYFQGETQIDRVTGQEVFLGGSKANTLGDMLEVFGLNPGAPNTMAATYTTFGNVVRQQYPGDLPSFDPFEAVSDLSYMRAAAEAVEQRYGHVAASEVQRAAFDPSQAAAAPLVGNRSWNIAFATGSADLTPAAIPILEELVQGLEVASNTFVEVNGHTDNVGDPAANQALSERRARAVETWLRARAPNAFPEGRVTVHGYGQTQPVAPTANQADPAVRAQNRRVQIITRANSAS